jgi:SPP1 family predicted phage head-tail adaptor
MAKPKCCSGERDRRVTILRTEEDGRDGFNVPIVGETEYGKFWASKEDVSDGEQFRAQEVGATLTTRFVVAWGAKARGILPTDILVLGERRYTIQGLKEVGTRNGIEISATARAESPLP